MLGCAGPYALSLVAGRYAAMTESEVLQSDGDEGGVSANTTVEAIALLPTAEQLEIAESILDRLKPSDRQDIGTMIHKRGQIAGIILASLGIFWWLSILNLKDGDPMNGYDSLIGGLSFFQVSWLLPILVGIGSLLNAAGRHRGRPAPSMLAGVLFLICLFFSAEPLVFTISTGGEFLTGAWQSIRLLILGVGTYFSARLFIEAYLLDWVKKLEEAYHGIELSSLDLKSQLADVEVNDDDEEATA